MAAATEFTYAEVATHNTKKDLFVVIHDKVYDVRKFVDEHPGGDEVLIDVAGQDATEAFEDVGHSDEAREILEAYLIGKLKRQPGDPTPKVPAPTGPTIVASDTAGLGVGLYALVLIGGLVAFFGYQYLQASSVQSTA